MTPSKNPILRLLVMVALLLGGCANCGGTPEPAAPPAGSDAAAPPIATVDSGSPPPAVDAGDTQMTVCGRPEVMIVLDRTLSMHRRTDGSQPVDLDDGLETSKWALALNAIRRVNGVLSDDVDFGLTLFPRDPGGDACLLLAERIYESREATNVACEEGENVVAIGSDYVLRELDPDSTRLCVSTPIGPAMRTTWMSFPPREETPQAVILITDGRDSCDSEEEALENILRLARVGIRTHVVGFDGSGNGIDARFLNNAACAGRTAIGFPAGCVEDGDTYRAIDPRGADLFLRAEDGESLTRDLAEIIVDACCDCDEQIIDDLI